MCTLEENVR